MLEKKLPTLVNFILDKSGSMESVKQATVSGLNEYIQTLQKDGNNYKFSLTLFDTQVTKGLVAVDLAEVSPMKLEEYQTNGGTALYDAVCQTINNVSLEGYSKVITIIMTDGEENASREYTQVHLKSKIEELQKTDKWTFVFLGANQDAWLTAQKFGMHQFNTVTYNSTDRGVTSVFAATATGTSTLSTSAAGATTNFFSEKDQEDLETIK